MYKRQPVRVPAAGGADPATDPSRPQDTAAEANAQEPAVRAMGPKVRRHAQYVNNNQLTSLTADVLIVVTNRHKHARDTAKGPSVHPIYTVQ